MKTKEKENGRETRTRTRSYAIAGTIAIAFALLTAMMVMPAATTVTFYPDNDAQIQEGAPGENCGDDTNELAVMSGEYNENIRTLIAHSDLSSIPSGVTIDSATLYLYMWYGDVDRTIDIHRVTASWTETGITWNNQPGYDSTPTSSTSTGTTADVWRTWDVTSDVQAFVDGTSNYGWLIKDNVEGGAYEMSLYWNSEYTDPALHPYLEVTYTEAPLEFGDAHDPRYPSLLASDGARHNATDTESIGLAITGTDWKDFEPDANVPNLDLLDDGLLTYSIAAGNPAQTVTFEVTELTGSPTLIANILIDMNIDGDWNDPGEHVVVNQPIAIAGGEGVVVSNPFSTVGAAPGPTWMRITLTRSPINPGWDGTMTGYAQMIPFECGETEDWEIELSENEVYLEPSDSGATHCNETIVQIYARTPQICSRAVR